MFLSIKMPRYFNYSLDSRVEYSFFSLSNEHILVLFRMKDYNIFQIFLSKKYLGIISKEICLVEHWWVSLTSSKKRREPKTEP